MKNVLEEYGELQYQRAHRAIDMILEEEIRIEDLDPDWTSQDDTIINILNIAEVLEIHLGWAGHCDVLKTRLAEACLIKAQEFNELYFTDKETEDE